MLHKKNCRLTFSLLFLLLPLVACDNPQQSQVGLETAQKKSDEVVSEQPAMLLTPNQAAGYRTGVPIQSNVTHR
jgi:hypothetical protein